jgi:hypothetical protein
MRSVVIARSLGSNTGGIWALIIRADHAIVVRLCHRKRTGLHDAAGVDRPPASYPIQDAGALKECFAFTKQELLSDGGREPVWGSCAARLHSSRNGLAPEVIAYWLISAPMAGTAAS